MKKPLRRLLAFILLWQTCHLILGKFIDAAGNGGVGSQCDPLVCGGSSCALGLTCDHSDGTCYTPVGMPSLHGESCSNSFCGGGLTCRPNNICCGGLIGDQCDSAECGGSNCHSQLTCDSFDNTCQQPGNVEDGESCAFEYCKAGATCTSEIRCCSQRVTDSPTQPFVFPEAHKVINIVAGSLHTCAILDNHFMKCFGRNQFGQLGIGENFDVGNLPNMMEDNLPYVHVGGSGMVKQVSLGGREYGHTCVVTFEDDLKCWGANTQGQLGLGDTVFRGDRPSTVPALLPLVQLGSGAKVKMVSTGREHTCAIILGSNFLKCFGSGRLGALGSESNQSQGIHPGEMGDNLPNVNLGTNRTVLFVATGAESTCVILDNKRLKCFGFLAIGSGSVEPIGNQIGQMGDNLSYVDLGEGRTVKAVSMNYVHTCVILDNDFLKCFGAGIFNGESVGYLGYGDTRSRGLKPNEMGENLPFVDLGTNHKVMKVSVGERHTCALLDNSELKCFGESVSGAIGSGRSDTALNAYLGDNVGEMGDSLQFVVLGVGRYAVDVTTGSFHTCVLLDDATVKCFGENRHGSLGLGDQNDRGDNSFEMGDFLPQIFLFSPNFTSFDFQERVSSTPSHNPSPLIVSFDVGESHTCVVFSNHGLKCFGGNSNGQLGLGQAFNIGDQFGDMGDFLPYVDLGTNIFAHSVRTGFGFSCVCVSNLPEAVASYKIKCFGLNSVGQLGYGDTKSRGISPEEMGSQLPFVSLGSNLNVVELSTGFDHVCVILDNHLLKCFGGNEFGQLGLGDREPRGDNANEMGDSLPFVNLGLNLTIKSLSLGNKMGCVIFHNNKLKCFGANGIGQLGLGDDFFRGAQLEDMGDQLPYVDLGTNRTALMVSCGFNHVCAVLDNSKLKCWGQGGGGALGYGNQNTIGNLPGQMGDNLQYVPLGADVLVSKVSAGVDYTCVILIDSRVKCFGQNLHGNLGLNDIFPRGITPSSIGDLLRPIKFSLSSETAVNVRANGHTCALTQIQVSNITKLYCFGQNRNGQLGTGNTLELHSPSYSVPLFSESISSLNLSSFSAEDLNFANSYLNGDIPTELGSLGQLTSLDLSQNFLTGISQSIQNLTNLTSFRVGNNNIRCDCEVLDWFGEWSAGKLKDSSEVLCGNQNSLHGLPISLIRSDNEAPCYEPFNVSELSVTTNSVLLGWSYPWKRLEPFSLHFDIDCFDLNHNQALTFVVPWDSSAQYDFSYNLTGLLPHISYACEVFSVYVWYDLILRDTGENPWSPVMAQHIISNSINSETRARALPESRRVRGPGSPKLNILTLSAAPSDAPQFLANTSFERHQISISWKPPSTTNCDLGTLTYRIEIGNSSDVFQTNELFFVLSRGIQPGTVYQLRVAAFNIFGQGTFTDFHEFTTREPCEKGTQEDLTTAKCVPCPIGKYNSVPNEACIKCPDSLPLTLYEGSTDIDSCQAETGRFKFNGTSEPCPVGANCDRFSSLSSVTLKPGFWRGYRNEKTIRACLHPQFCIGGNGTTISQSELNYCKDFHTGVYCESCISEYAIRNVLEGCVSCSDALYEQDKRKFLAFCIILIISSVICTLSYALYSIRSTLRPLSSSQPPANNSRKNYSADIQTKFKILLGMYQIAASFLTTFSEKFPPEAKRFMSWIQFSSFELLNVANFSCFFAVTHYSRLLIATITPLTFLLAAASSTIILKFHFRKHTQVTLIFMHLNRSLLKLALYVSFLIYPSVSAIIFKTFPCESYLDADGNERRSLRADYTIDCESVDRSFWISYAAVSIAIFPIGIICLYTILLYVSKEKINPPGLSLEKAIEQRKKDSSVEHLEFLFAAYEPKYYYFESLELLRKLILSCFVIVILDGTVSQLALTITLCVFALALISSAAPYLSPFDDRLATLAQISLFFTSFGILLYNFDVASTDGYHEIVITVITIISLIFPVFIAIYSLWASMKSQSQENKPNHLENRIVPENIDIPDGRA